jgi:O-palmitoleoyl-L-serine hydrolase
MFHSHPYLLLLLTIIVALGPAGGTPVQEEFEAARQTLNLDRLDGSLPRRLCKKNATAQCTALGATWSGGEATCRSDGDGYDVSSCVRASPRNFRERVRPADRDSSRWGAARCNDGSPFSFQVRLSQSGKSKTWVIGLNGGAMCNDTGFPCSQRPPALQTTDGPDRDFSPAFLAFVPGPPQLLSGPFDLSETENPTFHDANHVWAQYCSSDLYSGASTELIPNSASATGWYFSGRHNVKAMFETLKQRYGLDDSDSDTKILFLGQSAGGSGVIHNADTFVAAAPRTARRGQARLLLEGSWEADIDDPGMRSGAATTSDREDWRLASSFWHGRSNIACELAQALHGQPRGDCYLSKLNYRSAAALGLPVFYYQNASDPQKLSDHNVNDPASPKVEDYEELIRSEMRAARVNWLYQPADRRYIGKPLPLQIMSPFHVISTQRWFFDQTTPVWGAGNCGNSFKDALTRFWESKNAHGRRTRFSEFDNLPPGAF